MKAHLEALKKQRVRVFLVCILYFLLLLAVGSMIFLRDASHATALAVACVVLYLLMVRPVLSRYQQALRRAMLEISLGSQLSGMTYSPKEGLSVKELEKTELTPVPLSSHLSRELVTGRNGGFRVTLADVTFPFRSGGMNEMFSGCALRVESDEHSFAPLRIEAGSLVSGEADGAMLELLEELGSWIPGNLYVNSSGNSLHVILRGRFLGFKINPLMDVTEKTMSADPLPELKLVLRLARKLCR